MAIEFPGGVPARIEAERLTLRPWQPEDADALRASLDRSDAHLRPFIPFMKHEPRSLEATREQLVRIRRQFDDAEQLRYAIFANAVLVGEVMLIDRTGDAHAKDGAREDRALELGFWLDVEQTGHGFAEEASRALITSAFQLGRCECLTLQCEPENLTSRKLAAKLGFDHVSTTPSSDGERGLESWTLSQPADLLSIRALDANGDPLDTADDQR